MGRCARTQVRSCTAPQGAEVAQLEALSSADARLKHNRFPLTFPPFSMYTRHIPRYYWSAGSCSELYCATGQHADEEGFSLMVICCLSKNFCNQLRHRSRNSLIIFCPFRLCLLKTVERAVLHRKADPKQTHISGLYTDFPF